MILSVDGNLIAALVSIDDVDTLESFQPGAIARDALPLDECLEILLRAKSELKRVGVRHASIFGSVSRGDARADSDVDILVELDPKARVGLVRFVEIRERLQTLLNRNVDLVSTGSVDPIRDASIFRDKKLAF